MLVQDLDGVFVAAFFFLLLFLYCKNGNAQSYGCKHLGFFSFCLMCFKEKENIGHAEFGLKKKKLWNVITAASQCDFIVLLCPCPTSPEIHNNQLTMQISQHAVWELFWLVCNLQRLPLLLSNESFSYGCYFFQTLLWERLRLQWP